MVSHANIHEAMEETPINENEIHGGEHVGVQSSVAGRIVGGKVRPRSYRAHAGELAGHVGKLRYAMVRATTVRSMLEVYSAILIKAKKGDTQACRLVLEYTVGKPVDVDMQARIADLTEQLEDMSQLLLDLEAQKQKVG